MFILFANTGTECLIQYVSPACKDVCGYEVDELVGKSVYAMLHPHEIDTLRRIVQQSVEQNTVVRLIIMRWLQRIQQKEERSLFSMSSFNNNNSNNNEPKHDEEIKYLKVNCVASHCYDCVVLLISKYAPQDSNTIALKSSAEEVFYVDVDGAVAVQSWNSRDQLETDLMHRTVTWSSFSHESQKKEPRACLILNRFTSKCTIQFVTDGI